jgi:ABC-type Fe3+/spermidine/putrescine transport system ATPase subunit
MHEGRIEQEGPPAEVWRRPANAFVAEFLGWNVTRAFGNGLVAVRPDGIRLAVPGRHDAVGRGASGRADTGIVTGAITGVVTGRTFRRDHFLLRVALAAGPALHVAVRVDDPLPDEGATVVLAPDPASLVPLE